MSAIDDLKMMNTEHTACTRVVNAILDLAARLDDYKIALDACTDWISRRDKEMFEKEINEKPDTGMDELVIKLNPGQATLLHTALENFLAYLYKGNLGADAHGRKLTEAYVKKTKILLDLIFEARK